ncbi:amino acid ABC transporter ATP-binding/permease protein [Crassaminicella profunda]|uniref:amino acid ABC transporter ATP-binding/permease protein n=1 Tax=Crassaminicella profunda TaxID=1286698 RepID=UPI001CA7AC50|nr:ABC transporter ATP-binding protein [Crassaminicella profunda]QZY57410.1 ABC transporter ATP-binding protein/permease [Crassaminicella profunda]
MGKLIGLIKPLVHIMAITITMGVLGFLAAMFITIYGGIGIVKVLGFEVGLSLTKICTIMVCLAVARGFLRYIEQFSGHFIAFKLLAILRDEVFKKLRALSPAKLAQEEKGNLISIIMSDIELLEVFYAHTIAPIMIAVITSMIMILYIGRIHISLGLVAALGYFSIGFLIPHYSSRLGKNAGVDYRNSFGKMNSFMLDSLKGMKEIVLFNLGSKRLLRMEEKGKVLNDTLKGIKKHEGVTRAITDMVLFTFIGIMLFTGAYLYHKNLIDFEGFVIATIAMMSSFGPVVALSNLSNNLLLTLAAGDRVLNLLEENPMVEEVKNEKDMTFGEIKGENISFAYEEDDFILEDVNITISKGKIIGILGESGCGKSTLLRLFMRFWDTTKGCIKINEEDIKKINTKSLRKKQGFVTQDTFLFNESIKNNIRIGKKDATLEEIKEAAKKASIHDFIEGLPKGYDTNVGELGENMSGGEKQRLGMARAFLQDGEMIFLDEPTSNLDSLNEKAIIKTLKNQCKDKTVVLVSHRISTIGIADEVYLMESKKMCNGKEAV